MSKYLFVLLLAVPYLTLRAAVWPTNRIAIYLLADGADRQAIVEGRKNLYGVKLKPEPVLSDEDFLSYDFESHTFKVTAEAARRLCRVLKGREDPDAILSNQLMYRLDWPDTAFVLQAMGDRIYAGVFSSFHSSVTYEMPTIKSVDAYIGMEGTNNITFTIAEGLVVPTCRELLSQPVVSTNLIHAPMPIPQGGGAFLHESAQDIRDDKRIVTAFKSLLQEKTIEVKGGGN